MASDSAWPTQTEVAPWASARTAHLGSLSTSGLTDDSTRAGGGGRTYDFHGMTAASSGRKLARIFAGKELVEAARPVVNSQTTVSDSSQIAAADVPFISPSAIKPVSYQTGPGDRSMTPEEQAAANQARRDEQTQTPPVPGANQPPSPSAVQPANNPAPQQNPQPAQNPNPQQAPATTNPGTDNKTQNGPLPGQPIAPPAEPVAPPVEGVPQTVSTKDGGTLTSTIVAGTGGQTVDSETTDANGNVTRSRAVLNDLGGVTIWTAHADGTHSVTYLAGPGQKNPGTTESYTYSSASAKDLANGPNAYTQGNGNGNWAKQSQNADGSPSVKVTEKQPDGVTYYETEYLPGGGTKTTATRPGSPEFSTPWLVGEEHPDHSGWIYLPDGSKLVTRPDGSEYIEGQLANTIGELGDPGFSTGMRTSTGDTVTMMSWEDARRNAANDSTTAWFDAKHEEKGPASDPRYLDAQWRLYALDLIKGDPNILVKVTTDKNGKYQYSVTDSITGAERVITTINDEFAPGKPFEFTRHANNDLTDRDGDPLITVDGRLLRTVGNGDIVMPVNPDADHVRVYEFSNGSDSVHEIGFSNKDRAELGLGKFSEGQFVTRADSSIHYEIGEIPRPAGVNALRLYRSADGGLLYEDASGLHWATDPGRAPTKNEIFKAAALELTLLVAGEGVGWAVGKGIGYGINVIRSARAGAKAAAEAAEGTAESSADATARTGIGSTGRGNAAGTTPKFVVSPPASNRVVITPGRAEIPPPIVQSPVASGAASSGSNVGRAGSPANPHTTLPNQSAPIPSKQLSFAPADPLANTLILADAGIAGQLRYVIRQSETIIEIETKQFAGVGGRSAAQVVNRADGPGGALPPSRGGGTPRGGEAGRSGGGDSRGSGTGGGRGGATGSAGRGGGTGSGPSHPTIWASNGKLVPRVDLSDPRLSNSILKFETIDGRKYVIDKYGVQHRLGTGRNLENKDAVAAFAYLNRDLRKLGQYYDKSTGNGARYLIQDEVEPIVVKGLIDDTVVGSTSDLVKVTWRNGKIVAVESFDSTGSAAVANTRRTAVEILDGAIKTIKNKLAFNGKYQTQNVVFVAKDETQARAVAAQFLTNPNVRVIHPASGFDQIGKTGT